MNFYTNLLATIACVLLLVAPSGTVLAGDAAPPTPVVPPPEAASKVDATYIIGPGDILQIFVWRQPELSVSVPVRPDGKVSTPLVEDIVAVGKTPSQLAREMEKVLSEYVRSPQVNVIVTQPTSVFSQTVSSSATCCRRDPAGTDPVVAACGAVLTAAGSGA